MVNRLKIASGVTSPFQVSVSGVDVNSAAFNQLIFDGNQQPYRVWANSYIAANLIPYGAAGVVAPTAGPTTYSCPSGQFPLFNVMWRIPDGSPSDYLKTGKEVGGVIDQTDRKFYGISFARQTSPSGASYAYCNYLILRNFG